MPKLSIIIPVFNEINTIGEILKKIKAVELNNFEKEIILVDDGSTDGSADFLNKIQDKDCVVFLNKKNEGKGAAVKKGFEEATGDVVLIQDADLEYDPEDYPMLIEPIIANRADVVFGSRFLKNSHSKIVYKRGYFFSRFLNWFSNFLTRTELSDIYTCYKAFSKKVINEITPYIKSKRFGIEPELTTLTTRDGFRIVEVPIKYEGRTYQEGKKINWKDGLAAIWHIIRFNLFTTYE